MWTVALGMRGGGAMPSDTSRTFSFAREVLDWVAEQRANPAMWTAIHEEVAAVGLRHEAPDHGVFLQARFQIRALWVHPFDVLESLVHAFGALVSPQANWDLPAQADELQSPDRWPPPKPLRGAWHLIWSPPHAPLPGAWVHGGMVQGEGVEADPDWVIDRIAPLFSAHTRPAERTP